MVMHDALTVDLAASLAGYARAHQSWDARVDQLAQHLTRLDVDVVVADVPYLTLAAAHRANIPALAICSLNWADILQMCIDRMSGTPDAMRLAGLNQAQFERILEQMHDAYNRSSAFLQAEPSMPMPSINNAVPIGPVCAVPEPCSRTALESLARAHGHSTEGWFVLVSMGGIPTRLNTQAWPLTCLNRPVYYLIQSGLADQHPHALAIDERRIRRLGLSFANLFAACDLVISKPGYGTFVESACSGTPLLFLPRPDWPESTALVDWISRHGRAQALAVDAHGQPLLDAAMTRLLAQGRFAPVLPTGNEQAANYLIRLIRATQNVAR